MLWAGRLFNGSRVVDFSNSGGSAHSSVPIPLSIRIRSGRYGGDGRWRADRVARHTAVEGKGMGRMPMLRFGSWRGCGRRMGTGKGFFEFQWFRSFFCPHSLVDTGRPCQLRHFKGQPIITISVRRARVNRADWREARWIPHSGTRRARRP